MDNPLSKNNGFTWVKVASAVIIIAMAVMDWFTLYSLFLEMVAPPNAALYALTMATALEGLPFYLGMVHSERVDEGRYNRNDREVTRFGYWLAFSAMILVFLMAVGVRSGWFLTQWESGEIRPDEFWEELTPNALLAVLPIATSLLSYVASWFAFRSSYLETLYSKVVRKQDIFNRCKANFQQSYEAYQRARISLWASLVEDSREPMPKTSALYRKSCFAKIRAKLVANCLASYPTQVERYTQEVNQALEKCLLELADRSTLPHTITQMSLAELIAEHDETAIDYADCWDYNYAGADLEAQLRATLDNALVVAQFETAVRRSKQ